MKYLKIITVFVITTMVSSGAHAADEDLEGFGFGTGISLTWDTGNNDRVKEASLDANGYVRIDHRANANARIMLELHHFFTPTNPNKFAGFNTPGGWGHGPFVALQPGTEAVIEAVALGWMWGFKRSKDDTNSWNIGIGWVIDPDVQVLGEGITLNEKLEGLEDDVRFQRRAQQGLLVLFSVSF